MKVLVNTGFAVTLVAAFLAFGAFSNVEITRWLALTVFMGLGTLALIPEMVAA